MKKLIIKAITQQKKHPANAESHHSFIDFSQINHFTHTICKSCPVEYMLVSSSFYDMLGSYLFCE